MGNVRVSLSVIGLYQVSDCSELATGPATDYRTLKSKFTLPNPIEVCKFIESAEHIFYWRVILYLLYSLDNN